MRHLVLGTLHCFLCERTHHPHDGEKDGEKEEMTSSLPLKNLVQSYFPHYTDLGQYNLRF